MNFAIYLKFITLSILLSVVYTQNDTLEGNASNTTSEITTTTVLTTTLGTGTNSTTSLTSNGTTTSATSNGTTTSATSNDTTTSATSNDTTTYATSTTTTGSTTGSSTNNATLTLPSTDSSDYDDLIQNSNDKSTNDTPNNTSVIVLSLFATMGIFIVSGVLLHQYLKQRRSSPQFYGTLDDSNIYPDDHYTRRGGDDGPVRMYGNNSDNMQIQFTNPAFQTEDHSNNNNMNDRKPPNHNRINKDRAFSFDD